MTHLTGLTLKVLAFPLHKLEPRSTYIDWAIEMLEDGCDEPKLAQLAGLPSNSNSFEIDDFVAKSLRELALDDFTSEQKTRAFSVGIAALSLNQPDTWREALEAIAELGSPIRESFPEFLQLEESLRWIDEPKPGMLKLADYEEAKSRFQKLAERLVLEWEKKVTIE